MMLVTGLSNLVGSLNACRQLYHAEADWVFSHEQATIGKFYAPTPSMPDPLRSSISPNDALGGGGVWH